MKRKLSLFLVIIMAMVILLTGCGGSESEEATGTNDQEKQYKVGFIYVGPIGDGGWSYAQNEGRLYLEEKLGVPTIYKESVPEEAECEKVINDMIDEGCNIIFTTSFGFMDWTERAAKNHPDVYFFHCSGYKTLENMTAYFGPDVSAQISFRDSSRIED